VTPRHASRTAPERDGRRGAEGNARSTRKYLGIGRGVEASETLRHI